MEKERVSVVGHPYSYISVRLHSSDLDVMREISHEEDLPVATIARNLIKRKIALYAKLKKKKSPRRIETKS